MKKKVVSKPLVKRFPRLLGTGLLLVLLLLTVGVVAGLSRQESSARETGGKSAIISTDDTNAANSSVQVVPQTGQVKPLTQEEAQKLAVALKALANQSTEGLQQVRHADGTVSMDLQGRFQNVALAKRNGDGTLSQSCIDNPAAGAAFFGIDPKLVGVTTNTATSSSTSPNHK